MISLGSEALQLCFSVFGYVEEKLNISAEKSSIVANNLSYAKEQSGGNEVQLRFLTIHHTT